MDEDQSFIWQDVFDTFYYSANFSYGVNQHKILKDQENRFKYDECNWKSVHVLKPADITHNKYANDKIESQDIVTVLFPVLPLKAT